MAEPTVQVTNICETPLQLGDVVNLKASRRNTTPVPRPTKFMDVAYCDLGYGDCAAVGGNRYVLLIVDRYTRFTWPFGLKSLAHDNLTKTFIQLRLLVGCLAKRLYTDFDHRVISGKTQEYLNKYDCSVFGAPASRQHQNGLVERQ